MNIKSAAEFKPQDPQVGIYRGVSDEAYFSAKAVNHSTLKTIEQSPAHYKIALKKGGRDSDAKRLGALAHMMLFQPGRVETATIGPPINARTGNPYGSDTKAWDEYVAQHPGKLIVSQEEVQDATRAVQAIREHPEMSVIMCNAVENELVLVWEECDLMFKAKVDALATPIMGDLKTTKNADERAFARSIVDLWYHTQGALYLRGARCLGIDVEHFVIGALENETYLPVCYELDEHFLLIANTKIQEWIDKLRKCTETNHWPAYPTGVNSISPPHWLMSQFAGAEV